jgi:glutamate dehydrogenase
MLRLLVNHSVDEDFKQLAKELKRAKWVDDQVTDLGLVKYPAIGIDKAEIIVTFCSMLHGPLYKINNQSFGSIKTIISILDQSPHFMQTAEQIAQLFIDRFRPGSHISADEYTKRDNDLKTKISRLHHEPARILLNKLLEAVRATLRTNFYNEDRYALDVRVHPSIMHEPSANKPLPFGVLFAHGRHFNGFHNRFRDIARGGLRIVTPGNNIQYALESARQFDEAYGLSYAQQLKNKDIPEGGAKAVVLVNSPEIESDKRFFAARKSVKAFTDSILDLIVTDSVKNLVDYYQKDELIYLGPDEQVIPSDIDWICHRAAQRGYPIPAAFMSSKKGAGINHKEFGVTSEGIVVYLDVALKNVLKIDPRTTPFTIKVTGGPDGDVAGNLMKILFREYGDNCKIVGIADGFGVAEDPKGLDSKELLRLVEESLPITSFNTKRLSKQGIMLPATTEEGLQRRLSMCFRVKADAFVPAGGRPNTINIDNWKQFLDENGKPTSSLIVEGTHSLTHSPTH